MVSKIKKILVPLDGSSNSFRGLDTAIHMARQCHATLTGLYVVGITKPQTNEPIPPLEKSLLKHAQKIMKKAKLKAAKKGILFFDRMSYGDEEKRIVDVAEKKNFSGEEIGSSILGFVIPTTYRPVIVAWHCLAM